MHYLIEFRFFGTSKGQIKNLIWEINKRFHIRPSHRPVPHVSLVGPIYTKSESRLVSDFIDICEKQDKMEFQVDGFNTFEDNRVVYIEIEPDMKLDDFRWKLSQTLQSYCRLKPQDYERKFIFHATIAMKLSLKKFEQVNRYINKKSKPKYKNVLLRVTLLKNRKILREYDFLLKRLLNRQEAKSKTILSNTFSKLEKYLGKKINKVPIEIDLNNIKQGRIHNLIRKRNIFIISDTHFGHKNIIEYCNRPFKSESQMNRVIINNWNKTIRKKDVVFFLGDMRAGRSSPPTDYWLKKLNGSIYFLNGSHDTESRMIEYYDKLFIKYRGKRFLLLHDPADIPSNWDGWTIHGHHHNNHPEEFPFINGKTKLINVSVEFLNYIPLNINKLFELDFENIIFKETINSIPIMKKT